MKVTLVRKLIAFSVLIVCVTSAVIAGLSYGMGRQAVLSRIETEVGQAAQSVIAEMHRFLIDRGSNVRIYAFLRIVQDNIENDDPELALSQNLLFVKKESDVFADLLVANAQRKVVAASDPAWIGQTLAAEVALTERVAYTPRYTGTDVTLFVTAPVKASYDKEKTIGYFVGLANFQVIAQLLREKVRGQDAFVALLEDSGPLLGVFGKMEARHFQTAEVAGLVARKGLTTRRWGGADYLVSGARVRAEGADASADTFQGLPWTIVMGVDRARALAPIRALGFWILICALATTAAVILVASALSYGLSRPLKKTVALLKDICTGDGDLTQRMRVAGRDEIGELARWFNVFIEKLQGIMGAIHAHTLTLSTASGELSAVSTQLASGAEEMNAQAGMAASVGRQFSTSITGIASHADTMSSSAASVSSSIEAMSVSIAEVARNCEQESRIVKEADDRARHAREIMTRLGESAQQIGKVVEVIDTIADQTNLLALNATIEAASAGEAGKGFAVVANEVKALAKQSARAVGQIAEQIAAVQTSAQAAVKEVAGITGSVEQIRHISESIAASLEEQSATVSEIAKTVAHTSRAAGELAGNVQEAAKQAGEVSSNIQSVSQSAQQSSAGASQTQASALELDKLAAQLQAIVGQFKI